MRVFYCVLIQNALYRVPLKKPLYIFDSRVWDFYDTFLFLICSGLVDKYSNIQYSSSILSSASFPPRLRLWRFDITAQLILLTQPHMGNSFYIFLRNPIIYRNKLKIDSKTNIGTDRQTKKIKNLKTVI